LVYFLLTFKISGGQVLGWEEETSALARWILVLEGIISSIQAIN